MNRRFCTAKEFVVAAALAAVVLASAAAIIAFQHGKQAASLKDANPAVRVAVLCAMGWHGDAGLLIECSETKTPMSALWPPNTWAARGRTVRRGRRRLSKLLRTGILECAEKPLSLYARLALSRTRFWSAP